MVALIIGFTFLCNGLPKVNPTLVETYKDDKFIVTNTSDSTQKYKIELKDFDHNFNTYKYGSTDNTLDVTIWPNKFKLKPNETQKVHVEPNDNKDRTRWALANVRPLKKNNHKNKIETSESMAVQIFHYAEPVKTKIRVTNIKEDYFVVSNNGNIPQRIRGYYETKNIKANTIKHNEFQGILVFPYSSKKINIDFDYSSEEKLLLAVVITKDIKHGLKLRLD